MANRAEDEQSSSSSEGVPPDGRAGPWQQTVDGELPELDSASNPGVDTQPAFPLSQASMDDEDLGAALAGALAVGGPCGAGPPTLDVSYGGTDLGAGLLRGGNKPAPACHPTSLETPWCVGCGRPVILDNWLNACATCFAWLHDQCVWRCSDCGAFLCRLCYHRHRCGFI